MTQTTRRRWATALIATTTAVPLLLGGAATAAWAATMPDSTPSPAEIVEAPAPDPAPEAGIPDAPPSVEATGDVTPEAPIEEVASDPAVGGTDADVPASSAARDPQPISTNDPQPSPIVLTIDRPDPNSRGWYDAPVEIDIRATSRIGADVSIEWRTTGAQTGSGQAAGPALSLPITANGVTSVTISAVDSEGNSTGEQERTIKIDATTPTAALLSPDAPVYRLGDSAVADVECASEVSEVSTCLLRVGIANYVDGAEVVFDTLGVFATQAWAWNEAGTGGSSPHTTIRVIEDEDDAPTVELDAPPASGGWWKGPIVVTLTGADGDGSGVEHLEYRTLEDGVPGPWQTIAGATGTFPTSGEGDNRYQVRAVDWFGNVGTAETYSFPTDATAPGVSVSLPPEGATVAPGDELVLDFACDDALSGVEICAGPVTSGESLDTSEEGTFEVVVTARDRAGNETRVVRSYTVAVPDEVGPEIDVERGAPTSTGWYHAAPDVIVTATDPAGIQRIDWAIHRPDGSVETGSVSEGAPVRLPAALFGEGEWRVALVAVDGLGNETSHEFDLLIDGSAPVVTIDSPDNGTASLVLADREFEQGEEVAFEFTCTDAVSGVESCVSSVGDALPTDATGTFVAEVVAVDAAGHRAAQSLEYTVVEADEPVPGPGTGGGSVGGGAPGLAATGPESVLATVWMALGLLAVGGIAAGSVTVVRRGR